MHKERKEREREREGGREKVCVNSKETRRREVRREKGCSKDQMNREVERKEAGDGKRFTNNKLQAHNSAVSSRRELG